MAPTVNTFNSKLSFFLSLRLHRRIYTYIHTVMKFFLELVACCGLPMTDSSSATTAPAPRAEETKSLVKSSRQRQRMKRGRLGQSGSASAASAEWKPSLYSISEDNVIVGKSGDDRTAGAERVVKRKSGPGNARVHFRSSFNDEYLGRASIPTVIPAFSPTPFMF